MSTTQGIAPHVSGQAIARERGMLPLICKSIGLDYAEIVRSDNIQAKNWASAGRVRMAGAILDKKFLPQVLPDFIPEAKAASELKSEAA